jgi:hypothetical protein
MLNGSSMTGRQEWTTIAALILFLASYPKMSEGQLSIGSIWKARGFEASDNIQNLQKKIENYPMEGKEATHLKCKVMIEFAYAGHIAWEEMVHKKDSDAEFFHFILNGEEGGVFDLVYVYSKDGKHTLTRIDRLPKDWHLTILPRHPSMLGLRSSQGRCIFAFDVTDPFQAIAVEP